MFDLLSTLSDDAATLTKQLPGLLDRPDLPRATAERLLHSLNLYCQQTNELNQSMYGAEADPRLLKLGQALEKIFVRMREGLTAKVRIL